VTGKVLTMIILKSTERALSSAAHKETVEALENQYADLRYEFTGSQTTRSCAEIHKEMTQVQALLLAVRGY
jgi:lactam utilization protein B